MNLKNRYFLLRHGQTIYQKENRSVLYPSPENPPIELTEEGRGQIKKAAKELKNRNIDLIFSSVFFRTRQTAVIVGKELNLKPKFDKRLRDINLGIFQGGLKENYKNFFAGRMEKFTKRPKNGESWQDIKKRLLDFLKEIEKKYKNKNILIISHGDPLWLLAGIIKGIKKEEEFLKRKHQDLYPDVGDLISP